MKIRAFRSMLTSIFVLAFAAAPAFSADKQEPRAPAGSYTRTIIRDTGQKSKHVETRTLSGKVVTGPGKALTIDTSQARVTVTGWSGNEVVVEAKIEVGADKPEVVSEFLAATELLVEPEEGGGRIRLRSPFDEDVREKSKSLSETLRNFFRQRRISLSYSAWLDVKVPASQSLAIKNAFGDVTVRGVTGRHDIRNESGEVKVENCGGGMRLETSFASVSVTDFKGDVDVRSESGAVNIKNIGGRADVRNSFSQVTFERVGGDLTVKSESSGVRGTGVGGLCRVESSFAEIDVGDVTGNLEIKGDSMTVTVAGVKGDVTVESSFAPVKVTNVDGALRVTAESSAVNAADIGRTASIRSSFASIEVRRTGGDVKVDGESSPVLVEDPGEAGE
ncbi:MAG: hypothetical protein OEW05_09490, partial [Candidatus Aminicenantes bacterium]|nr:hypothetical protein [Candidatus Aminicenantes bacterium]